MTLRSDLHIGGNDPASVAGQIAFLELPNEGRAQYLKRIEYLSHDVANLLDLLTEDDRSEVLAYRDSFGSELSWP